MLICVLNAAEGQLDIILNKASESPGSQEVEMLSAHSISAPTKGAEILTPALQNLCALHGITPQDIERYACVHGPGSFTGLRLIMSTVAAIRRITGASNAGIDYMQALALTAQLRLQSLQTCLHKPSGEYRLCVLTHARRNLVHYQCFSTQISAGENFLPKPLGEVVLLSPVAVAQALTHFVGSETPMCMLGSGVQRNMLSLQENLPSIAMSANQKTTFLDILHPSVEALSLLAQHAQYHNDDLQPLYIRPCDAVENLTHIAQKQGMDADAAHARLQELLQKSTD